MENRKMTVRFYSPLVDQSRIATRSARSWHSAMVSRCANLAAQVQASVIAGDGRARELRRELEIARNVTRLAAEDATGWKHLTRRLER
jgi:hypothetical protein